MQKALLNRLTVKQEGMEKNTTYAYATLPV